MTETPIPFQFENFTIRAVGTPEEPWFVAADVCAACLVRNVSDSTKDLNPSDKVIGIVDTLGGPQNMLCVNESGLYDLVLKSRKPEAKRFRRWITSEVLPTIRKTGTFTVLAAEPVHAIPQTYGEALLEAGRKAVEAEIFRKTAIETARVAESRGEALKEKTAEVRLLAPKAEFYDHLIDSAETFPMEEAVRLAGLPFGPIIANQKLREMDVLGSLGTRYNMPRQHYITKLKYFVVKEKRPLQKGGSPIVHNSGEPVVNKQHRVTHRGIVWLIKTFNGKPHPDWKPSGAPTSPGLPTTPEAP
jgi:prophage antirepressor-like protein